MLDKHPYWSGLRTQRYGLYMLGGTKVREYPRAIYIALLVINVAPGAHIYM
jgi:hypothetical protein